MVRRYGDPVEVRPVGETGQHDPRAPGSFLWQGRLYVVRSVLGHWRERRSWWTASAARAVHGEATAESLPHALSTPAAVPGRRSVLGEEREVWRVEASPGRGFGSGVYDLCRDPDPAPTGTTLTGSWRLLRVAD